MGIARLHALIGEQLGDDGDPSISAIAWAVIAIAGAVAFRRAGANGLTVGLMAASILFVNHPVPAGTLGMLALFAAAFLWDRHRKKTGAGAADSTATVAHP